MKHIKPTDNISRSSFLRKLAVALPFLPAGVATAHPQTSPKAQSQASVDLGNLRAFVELARSDIRTQKALIIAENIPLTEEEAVEFWPVHRDYETELNKLLDDRYSNILEFAKTYASMTDQKATEVAKHAFDLEEKRTALKRKYFKKFAKVVPAIKATRFFQIENQLNLVLDLQIASSIPLIK